MDLADRDAYDRVIRESCERAGLLVVQRQLAEGQYGERKARIVRAWVAEQAAEIDAAEKEIDRAIPRHANDIATDANRIATSARNWSIIAAAIAAVALAVAMYAAFREFPVSMLPVGANGR